MSGDEKIQVYLLEKALGAISSVERQIILRRSGQAGEDNRSISRIARTMHLSKAQIHTLEDRAIQSIKEYMEHPPTNSDLSAQAVTEILSYLQGQQTPRAEQ